MAASGEVRCEAERPVKPLPAPAAEGPSWSPSTGALLLTCAGREGPSPCELDLLPVAA